MILMIRTVVMFVVILGWEEYFVVSLCRYVYDHLIPDTSFHDYCYKAEI
jgi:hypothetical protein